MKGKMSKNLNIEENFYPMTKVTELEEKIEGYKKIIGWILNNHYRFGDMEELLLKKIETIGKKYNL